MRKLSITIEFQVPDCSEAVGITWRKFVYASIKKLIPGIHKEVQIMGAEVYSLTCPQCGEGALVTETECPKCGY